MKSASRNCTTDRGHELRKNDAVGCSHMRSHAYSATLRPAGDLANYQRNWDFWECWYIARGDSLAENCAM